MAKVKIGGRELEVLQANLGFMRNTFLPWQRKLSEIAKAGGDQVGEAIIDHTLDGVLLFVGHNEDVTRDWLLEAMPPYPQPVLDECARAAGLKWGGSEGEAKSQ